MTQINVPFVSYDFEVFIADLFHPLERARVKIVIEALINQTLSNTFAKSFYKRQL